MRRRSSAMWITALAAVLLATIAVARRAPDHERLNAAVLDASRPIADPIPDPTPYGGWWKGRQ